MLARKSRLVGRIADRPYLLLSMTAFFWGANIVLGRAVAGHVPPIALAELRWVFAFLIALPLAWPHLKGDLATTLRHWPVMLVLSLTGIALYNTLGYWGLQRTPAINGLLLQSGMPLMIGFWSLVLFGDRLQAGQIAGILLSLAGVVAIVTRGHPEAILGLALNPGDVAMAIAVVVYALYSALLKRRPAMHPLSFLAITMGLGALMLVPAFAWELTTGYRPQLDVPTVLAVGYVALFPSVIAYLCFNRGVELIGPNRAGPFFHLVPVFGSALAILFLGESPRWYHAVGYALILAGIVAAQRFRGADAGGR